VNGHLDCLKYLHETAKAPWNSEAVRVAHENKHTECVQYLLDNNCPLPPFWRYEHGTLYDSEDEEILLLLLLALFYVFCSPFDVFFSNFTPFHTKRKADTPYAQKGALDVVAKSISRENESVDVSRVQHVVGLFSC
jgi:hypothetical protein